MASCRTFTVRAPRKRKITRCDDRKLSDSAKARYRREGACRENGRFVACDMEDPAPRSVRKAEAKAARAAERAARERTTAKLCFRTKADMLEEFRDANLHIMEPCERDTTGQSFDPVNHKYDRDGKHGRKKATTCEEAVRVASPTEPPYCIDRIDLDALNDLEIAKRKGGFRLPPEAVDALAEREERERYRGEKEDPYGPRPSELEGVRRKARRR